MTALSPPLAGRAVAVTQCRTLFTSERIIRQSDRNYRPEPIKLTYSTFSDKWNGSIALSARAAEMDGHDPPMAGQLTPIRESREVRSTSATALFGRALGR